MTYTVVPVPGPVPSFRLVGPTCQTKPVCDPAAVEALRWIAELMNGAYECGKESRTNNDDARRSGQK